MLRTSGRLLPEIWFQTIDGPLRDFSGDPRAGFFLEPRDVAEWFWDETSAGKLFMALEPVLAGSDDKMLRFLAERMLIPRAQFHKLPEEDQKRYMATLDPNKR